MTGRDNDKALPESLKLRRACTELELHSDNVGVESGLKLLAQSLKQLLTNAFPAHLAEDLKIPLIIFPIFDAPELSLLFDFTITSLSPRWV